MSSIILGIIAILFNNIGNLFFFSLVLLSSLVLLYEYYSIFDKKILDIRFYFTCIAILLICLSIYLHYLVFTTLIFFVAALILYILALNNQFFYFILPLFYFGIPSALLIYLNHHYADGKFTILWIFSIVWATDSFGYFFGKTFKGPKLYKSISPNKTWTGFFGALIGAMFASLIFCYIFEYESSFHAIFYGLLISLSCIVGDLFESYIKRINNKKDSSALLPGHGGLLDRLDGFLFAIVISSLLKL